MEEIKFVSSENLKTLEHYAASCLSAMITLRTLEGFHLAAFKEGLLNEEQAETGKTLCWEIRRLMQLYRNQLEDVLERTEITEEMVHMSLQDLITMDKR